MACWLKITSKQSLVYYLTDASETLTVCDVLENMHHIIFSLENTGYKFFQKITNTKKYS